MVKSGPWNGRLTLTYLPVLRKRLTLCVCVTYFFGDSDNKVPYPALLSDSQVKNRIQYD